jgi:hypothetical protein
MTPRTKKQKQRGRPRIEVTATMKRTARKAAGYGLTDEQIATLIGVCESSLKNHCAKELASGRVEASSKVQETAFAMANSGKIPAMTIFWLKVRCGWKEPAAVELTGKDGGPVETIIRVVREPFVPPTHDDEDA